MFFCCWVRTWRGLWRRAGNLSRRGLTNKFTWLLASRSRIKLFLSTFHRFEPNGLLIPYLWAAGGPTRWEQQFRQGSSACKRFRKPLLCASIATWKVLYELNISTQKLLECFRNWEIVVISSFGSWREKISHDTNQFQDKTKVVNRSLKPICWIWTKYDMSKLIKPRAKKTEEADAICPALRRYISCSMSEYMIFRKIKNNCWTSDLVNCIISSYKNQKIIKFREWIISIFTMVRSLPCFTIHWLLNTPVGIVAFLLYWKYPRCRWGRFCY